ncbi:probable multidrug resistance-associated protein lethal(2)03659 isoform X3 [Tribolium castaneum]
MFACARLIAPAARSALISNSKVYLWPLSTALSQNPSLVQSPVVQQHKQATLLPAVRSFQTTPVSRDIDSADKFIGAGAATVGVAGSEMWVGYIGLAITQSTSLVGLIQYGTKTWSELDSQMTSVERVVEYAELEPEKDDGTTVPSDLWPNNGRILFDDVTMKYPLSNTTVLKSVTFNINPGEKIGIVGRTGAGKSSLISVLFRLFHFDGTVLIDGADTKTLPLSILRSKIAIIPQDPVLFLGSLRQNLDPFEQFSDSQLWSSLEEVELKEMVTNWAQGLETTILEGGANVSVGQRQLLCLVRAILRNSKIIVLDEATANVDLKTDEVIQKVVRRKFRNCTVLTIAHRLNTIMDSDKILVMDAGTVAEFGPPAQLLKNENGLFYGFVQTSGKK